MKEQPLGSRRVGENRAGQVGRYAHSVTPVATPLTSEPDAEQIVADDWGPRLARLGLLIVPVLAIVVMGWARRWNLEDAFLNYRIVDQIRAGHGPVFNIGQRVEVATSPLWLWTLVLVRTVVPFVKLEVSATFVGLVGTAAGIWWAQLGATRLWGGTSERLFIPVGALVYVFLPPSWDWATSGLENGMTTAWLGALMLVLGTVARRDAPMATPKLVGLGVLVGLGPLIRPDLAVVTVAVAAALLWLMRPRPGDVVRFVGALTALSVLYEIFRAGYYATLVPNTALAKDASGSYWGEGWNYVVDLFVPYGLLIPMVVVLGVGGFAFAKRSGLARPPVIAALALPAAGTLHALFMTKTGGDYLHARLLLPSVFMLLAPIAAMPWRRWLAAPIAVIAIWALVAGGWLRPSTERVLGVPFTRYNVAESREMMQGLTKPGHRPLLVTDFAVPDAEQARRFQSEGQRDLVSVLGPPLRDVTPSRTTLISVLSGVAGYAAGPEVIVHEANALADVVGSRMPAVPGAIAGHRKRESWPWMIAMTTRGDVSAGEDADMVAAARRALECGALADLQRVTEAPLTVGRFFGNVLHAYRWTTMVVPRGELAAEREYCR